MTLKARRGARISAVSALLLVGIATSAVAAAPVPALTAASSQPSTITASTMTVAGFRYTGITTLAQGGGTVRALTFVMSRASMQGFALAVPCQKVASGLSTQFDLAVPAAASVASPGAMTVYATEVDYATTDTTVPTPTPPPFRWTVAVPPPQHLLFADAGTLTGVKIAVTRLDAATLTMNSVRSTSSFC